MRLVLAILVCVLLMTVKQRGMGQDIYTARAYWQEANKSPYLQIKQKIERGDSLTEDEMSYKEDYEAFLFSFFQKMSPAQREEYARMKPGWDRELASPASAQTTPVTQAPSEDFEFRTKDRLANGLYGLWYGIAIDVVGGIGPPAATGIPLITTGLWMMEPAINAKKYQNVTRATIRAGNTGRILGIIYGGALGFAISPTFKAEERSKWAFGLSAVTSIALGEVAFHKEKVRNFSAGHVEMVRHYGFVGPWIGFATSRGLGSESSNIDGMAIVAGGIAGLLVGNRAARKYAYTRGDADVIGSLTLISTGVGFAFIGDAMNGQAGDNNLFFVPAAMSIVGTLAAQRQVKGAQLTDQQGSAINLASGGAALIGLGVLSLTKANSASAIFGVPSALALITHQIFLSKYKNENAMGRLRGGLFEGKHMKLSMKVTPESYLYNRNLPVTGMSPATYAMLQNPVVKVSLTFK